MTIATRTTTTITKPLKLRIEIAIATSIAIEQMIAIETTIAIEMCVAMLIEREILIATKHQ